MKECLTVPVSQNFFSVMFEYILVSSLYDLACTVNSSQGVNVVVSNDVSDTAFKVIYTCKCSGLKNNLVTQYQVNGFEHKDHSINTV